VPFASAIRAKARILTGAVGVITEAEQADEIITSGEADIVLLAREMLREPYWALKAQQTLGQEPDWPLAYGYAVRRPRREASRNTPRGPAAHHVPRDIERSERI
jgi:2,4-dienoyl-CoA reductase (NADPH2)